MGSGFKTGTPLSENYGSTSLVRLRTTGVFPVVAFLSLTFRREKRQLEIRLKFAGYPRVRLWWTRRLENREWILFQVEMIYARKILISNCVCDILFKYHVIDDVLWWENSCLVLWFVLLVWLQSWTKVLGYFCISGAFSNSDRPNPSPHSTNNVGRVYPDFFFPSFNFVWGGSRETCKKIWKKMHYFLREPRNYRKMWILHFCPKDFCLRLSEFWFLKKKSVFSILPTPYRHFGDK